MMGVNSCCCKAKELMLILDERLTGQTDQSSSFSHDFLTFQAMKLSVRKEESVFNTVFIGVLATKQSLAHRRHEILI